MRRLRLIAMLFLAVAAVVSISCSADQASDPSNGLTVAKCAPAVPGFVSKTIGTGGGTLAIGKNKLVVPAGALTSSVSMSMEILADSSSSVVFQPQGLTFAHAKPAQLTLAYDQCTSPSAVSQAVWRSDHDPEGPRPRPLPEWPTRPATCGS